MRAHVCISVCGLRALHLFISIGPEADNRLKRLHVVLPVSLIFLLGLKYISPWLLTPSIRTMIYLHNPLTSLHQLMASDLLSFLQCTLLKIYWKCWLWDLSISRSFGICKFKTKKVLGPLSCLIPVTQQIPTEIWSPVLLSNYIYLSIHLSLCLSPLLMTYKFVLQSWLSGSNPESSCTLPGTGPILPHPGCCEATQTHQVCMRISYIE